jgi:hypothetical protein
MLIHRLCPWKHSTGPQTAAGKVISSRNATRTNSITAQLESINADLRMARRVVTRAMKAR